MDLDEVVEVIEGMKIGFNRETGERLFDTKENPKIVEALAESLEILEKEQKRIKRKNNRPKRAKERWTDEEENKLVKEYNNNKDKMEFPRLVEKLAAKHQRTEGSIRSRISQLI